MKIVELAPVNQHRCQANCPFSLFSEISLLALTRQNILNKYSFSEANNLFLNLQVRKITLIGAKS